MHYNNGREAKNGDKVALMSPADWDSDGNPTGHNMTVGILYDAKAGNDFCNGKLALIAPNDPCPNLKACLHLDDVLSPLSGDEHAAMATAFHADSEHGLTTSVAVPWAVILALFKQFGLPLAQAELPKLRDKVAKMKLPLWIRTPILAAIDYLIANPNAFAEHMKAVA